MDKNDPNSARLRFGIACFQAIQILRKETTGHRHELSPKTGLKVSFKPNASRCYAMGLVSTHNFMKYFGNQFWSKLIFIIVLFLSSEQSFTEQLPLNHPPTLLAKAHSDFAVTGLKRRMPSDVTHKKSRN